MTIANTPASYGSPARILHWLTALLILSAVGLALYAEGQPRDTGDAVARLAFLYSLHKTIGVAAFFTALARILWALSQTKPQPLHPERRLETFLGEAVHWALYGAMLIMPLSGWIYHSAVSGFAPILWPFGQNLPLVPKSESLAHGAEAVHKLSALVLYGAVGLHIVGALKHAFIDRDATLARMTHGKLGAKLGAQPKAQAGAHGAKLAPFGLALVLWAVILASGLGLAGQDPAPAPANAVSAVTATTPEATTATASAPAWQLREGSLTISLLQMGSAVQGQFTGWQATIHYDPQSRQGDVRVTIPVAGLALGSVTQQALGPEFFDAANHPSAVFSGPIRDEAGQLIVDGTLALRGVEIPARLPFDLTLTGDEAKAQGQLQLDRRDFGMGASYGDEKTVGFGVTVTLDITATRQ